MKIGSSKLFSGQRFYSLLSLSLFFFITLCCVAVSFKQFGAKAKDLPLLQIPTIALTSPVQTSLVKNRALEVPDHIVGSYSVYPNKTLLVGHSSEVFQNLAKTKIKDQIKFNHLNYSVTRIQTVPKSEISMKKLLTPTKTENSSNVIILMTCAGQPLQNPDYSHRLIVTAKQI